MAELDSVDELNRLGIEMAQQGNLHEATVHFQHALQLKPDSAQTHNNLGLVLQHQGHLEEAARCYRRSLELKPDNAGSYNNLGTLLHMQGNLAEAVACFQRAVDCKPGFAEACNNLGNALRNLGKALHDENRPRDAIACYQQVLQLQPDNAEAYNDLGNVLQKVGQLSEAITCYQHALRIKPDYAEAHGNLGTVLQAQGQVAQAIASYQRALQIKPHLASVHGNLLYALNFSPDHDAQEILKEHRRWNQRYAEPLAGFIQPHDNDPSPDRRLRIGYVSSDFSSQPLGWFLLPLLEAHDHKNVEVFCYSSVSAPDDVTDCCRAHADVWHDVLGRSDELVAGSIRQDRIDILVDLTMHAAENRLLVFARKPAPVQVTYLAYCGTTGLTAMDYRLTDPYLDVREAEDRRQQTEGIRNARDQEARCYAEESIWLPQTYWCYRPPIETPQVSALPASHAKHVTFGCLNDFCKISEPTLLAWSHLFQALPESRLLLHARAGSHDRVRTFFAGHHVTPERLTFVDMMPLSEYFRFYERLDIALDPFPYGGGTTTCDALWMGVPVVTLAGRTAVGRGGLSILSNVGLADLVAYDTEQYVRIAVDLASDLPRLSKLRATLRERMRASPLMEAPRFARAIETAYREIWHRWCGKKNEE